MDNDKKEKTDIYQVALNLLTHIYEDSDENVVVLCKAYADNDYQTIWRYLHQVRVYVGSLCNEIEKDNPNLF